MSSLGGLAQQVLERIAEIWHIDTGIRWIKGGESEAPGFDWWPGDFRVSARVNVSKEASADGELKVVISTDFLKDVATESDRFVEWAAATAFFANSTYGWVYLPPEIAGPEPVERLLRLGSTAYVTQDTIGWMPELLARTALLQPINAQFQTSIMPEEIGSGEPDTSRPAHLRHLEFHEIFEVVASDYAPLGKGPSCWSGTDELKLIAEKWDRSNPLSDIGDPAGISLEVPFKAGNAHIDLLTVEVHPQLGHGLMATLQLPYFGPSLFIAKEAAALNLLEFSSWTGFPQLGCWHANEMSRPGESGLAFTLFMPNALHRRGLATHIAVWFLRRARWAYEQVRPDMQDLPMLNDLEQRLGRLSEEIDRDWNARSVKQTRLLTRMLGRFRSLLGR